MRGRGVMVGGVGVKMGDGGMGVKMGAVVEGG